MTVMMMMSLMAVTINQDEDKDQNKDQGKDMHDHKQ